MAQPLISLYLFLMVQHLYLQSAASEVIKIHVPTSWMKILIVNNTGNGFPVTETSEWTKGLLTFTTGKSLVATEEFPPDIYVGQKFEIQRLEFSYLDYGNYRSRNRRESMDQGAIYGKVERERDVTIPARTLLTKWQLVANVGGHDVGYDHTVETYGGTMPHIHSRYHHRHGHNHHHHHHHHGHNHGHHHNDFSIATLVLSRQKPIHYGRTRIRIRHKDTNHYLAVDSATSGMSPATLSSSSGYQFILHNGSSGVKVQTMNPVHRGYDLLTSDATSQAHFTSNNPSFIQHWVVNKTFHLLDGDVVTLMRNDGMGFLAYDGGQVKAAIFGSSDEWILEAV